MSVCNGIYLRSFMIIKLHISVTLDVLVDVGLLRFYTKLPTLGCDTSVKTLLILQNRVVRTVCGDRFRTHCNPVFKSLGVLTEPSFYSMQLLVYVRSSLVHDHFFRQSSFHRV